MIPEKQNLTNEKIYLTNKAGFISEIWLKTHGSDVGNVCIIVKNIWVFFF